VHRVIDVGQLAQRDPTSPGEAVDPPAQALVEKLKAVVALGEDQVH
jgi:hypothetical protein